MHYQNANLLIADRPATRFIYFVRDIRRRRTLNHTKHRLHIQHKQEVGSEDKHSEKAKISSNSDDIT